MREQSRGQRLFGLTVVLVLHALVLSALWHYRLLPVPDAETLLVDLVSEDRPPPAPEPPRPPPPKPEIPPPPPPVELPPPVRLVVETPIIQAVEPVAPPPPAPPPEPPPPPPPPPAPPVKTVNAVTLASELAVSCPQRSAPTYPAFSKRIGEQGKVVLRVELDEQGRVAKVTLEQSSGSKRLDEAAQTAVKTWRCNPATRDGVAVRAVAMQPFNFVLEGR
jgi:protein TonB